MWQYHSPSWLLLKKTWNQYWLFCFFYTSYSSYQLILFALLSKYIPNLTTSYYCRSILQASHLSSGYRRVPWSHSVLLKSVFHPGTRRVLSRQVRSSHSFAQSFLMASQHIFMYLKLPTIHLITYRAAGQVSNCISCFLSLPPSLCSGHSDLLFLRWTSTLGFSVCYCWILGLELSQDICIACSCTSFWSLLRYHLLRDTWPRELVPAAQSLSILSPSLFLFMVVSTSWL